MGNNASGGGGGGVVIGRRTGSLGLSKSELDRRCRPSGLYRTCQWEDKAIRRLIADGKLAGRRRGYEDRQAATDHECPICFLQYPEVNITSCCQANICTECYLQVRPQKERCSVCPFCNHNKLNVTVAKNMTYDDVQRREEEEQRAIEATIKKRLTRTSNNAEETALYPTDDTKFGSSLAQSEAIRRANSFKEDSSSPNGSATNNNNNNNNSDKCSSEMHMLRQLSLSEEDRRTLEDEMKAQHTHPLARQAEAEARERRIQNEREYYRNHSGRRLRGNRTGRSIRNRAFGLVDAFDHGSGGEVESLEDLVALEAALILSMEEARRHNEQQNGHSENATDEEIAATSSLSLGASASTASSSRRSSSDNTEFLRQSPGYVRGNTDYDFGNGNSMVSSASSLSSRLRNRSLRTPDGDSEDNQLAMAIALSLSESEQMREGQAQHQGQGQGQRLEEVDSTGDNSDAMVPEDDVAV